MYKSQIFTYHGYQATLWAFRGKVAEAQQNRTVHTHISGGGGTIYSGTKIPSYITPTTTINTEHVHDRFFLVDEMANQETDISLTDWNFSARTGHDVAFCWLIPQGKNRGPYVYGANYTLNRERFNKTKLPRFNLLYRTPFQLFRIFATLLIAFICFAIPSIYSCVTYNGINKLNQCAFLIFRYLFNGISYENYVAGGIGLIGGWFAIRWFTQICFAKAINKGIRAEQQMRSDICALCQQALKTNKEA